MQVGRPQRCSSKIRWCAAIYTWYRSDLINQSRSPHLRGNSSPSSTTSCASAKSRFAPNRRVLRAEVAATDCISPPPKLAAVASTARRTRFCEGAAVYRPGRHRCELASGATRVGLSNLGRFDFRVRALGQGDRRFFENGSKSESPG